MRVFSKNENMDIQQILVDTVGKFIQYKEIYFQVSIGIVIAVSMLAWLKGD
jgi:hypothetical protein